MRTHQNGSIDNRWFVERHLQDGGQARVFLVSDLKKEFPGLLVLKKIHANNKDAKRRLNREIELIQSIESTKIPKIRAYSIHDDRNDQSYIVYDYINGPTLGEYLRNTQIEAERVLELFDNMLQILEILHSNSVCHRDIKPNNIVLKNGSIHQTVLIDFGLARSTKEDDVGAVTRFGEFVGNRFLILPENSIGINNDPRTDVTQCCGVIFFALTRLFPAHLVDQHGHQPHERENAKKILQALEPIERAVFDSIFEKAFRFELAERWQSAQELRQFLYWKLQITRTNIGTRAFSIPRGVGLGQIHRFVTALATNAHEPSSTEFSPQFLKLDQMLQEFKVLIESKTMDMFMVNLPRAQTVPEDVGYSRLVRITSISNTAVVYEARLFASTAGSVLTVGFVDTFVAAPSVGTMQTGSRGVSRALRRQVYDFLSKGLRKTVLSLVTPRNAAVDN